MFLWFTLGILPQVHPKFPCGVPTQDTAVILFQYIQNFPPRFTPPVSPPGKHAAHSKLPYPVPT